MEHAGHTTTARGPARQPTDVAATDTEPADPDHVDHRNRRQTRLASPSLKASRLPTPLVECGCGDCPDLADPLAETDIAALSTEAYAADECPDPQPMSVERAAQAYLAYQRAAWNSDGRTSTYERALGTYAGLLESDRRLRRRFGDDLTTAMVTCRLSPLDDAGEWIPPVTLDQQLQQSYGSVMDALRYQLDAFDWEYIAVTATTDSAATPHTHVYVWIRDPEAEVCIGHFESALQKHLDQVPNAYESDHQYRADGSGGAITVAQEPSLVDDVPDQFTAIREQTTTAEEGGVPANTAGAQYLASQLPHLVLGDVFDGTRDAEDVGVDGGTIAWAATHKWIRSNEGVTIDPP